MHATRVVLSFGLCLFAVGALAGGDENCQVARLFQAQGFVQCTGLSGEACRQLALQSLANEVLKRMGVDGSLEAPLENHGRIGFIPKSWWYLSSKRASVTDSYSLSIRAEAVATTLGYGRAELDDSIMRGFPRYQSPTTGTVFYLRNETTGNTIASLKHTLFHVTCDHAYLEYVIDQPEELSRLQ